TGKYSNCSSKSNKQTGYCITMTANPEMLGCVAENNGLRGFEIRDNSTGKYSNCSSNSNKASGYWILGTANPSFRNCIAISNSGNGFRTDSKQKIVVDGCKSDNNARGFAYTKGAHFLHHDCSVDGRKEGLFHKNFVEISVFESEEPLDIDIWDSIKF
ncbi:MAG: right-handed parallel beta-helix repeat-containing protein, partial [Bacteroidales bacterium]|nr:right-handed parallel beta-helix repeat-containing protein [Bacteroidales bacterium]